MHHRTHCDIQILEDADEFLEDLPERVKVKFSALFREIRYSEKGFIPNTQKMKKLKGGSGIWELKVKVHGIGNFRVLCFQNGPTWVLTHGFHKKEEETRKSEIEKAERIRDEYLTRKRSKLI